MHFPFIVFHRLNSRGQPRSLLNCSWRGRSSYLYIAHVIVVVNVSISVIFIYHCIRIPYTHHHFWPPRGKRVVLERQIKSPNREHEMGSTLWGVRALFKGMLFFSQAICVDVLPWPERYVYHNRNEER